MEIERILQWYAAHPSVVAATGLLTDVGGRSVVFDGLRGSAAAVAAAALHGRVGRTFIHVADDEEVAAYFYNDLVQLLGNERVLFLPSSQRKGKPDSASILLRCEVLAQLAMGAQEYFVVSYAEAMSEPVARPQTLNDRTIVVRTGEHIDMLALAERLADLGFEQMDYVYMPGQFAMRGSILDIYSYSAELPMRIDFFGNEIETISSFETGDQLSAEQFSTATIVPNLLTHDGEQTDISEYFPASHCRLALTSGRLTISSGANSPSTTLPFQQTAQPLYHKNFDLITEAFAALVKDGYTIYICSDSRKQVERVRSIFEDRGIPINITHIERTLHEGFLDSDLQRAFFTDHQLFDRFHKYTLRNEKVRHTQATLTLKDIKSFHVGNYVTHIDHGIGKFGGLVRIPTTNGKTQEVIKLIYAGEDLVLVSIHALHKLSKFKGGDGKPPRISSLGNGAWERMKERTKKHIKDIARDLIRLYARRRDAQGFAFSPDTYLQTELEASFLYEDTPDQLRATQDIKRDMERQMPMDRLICGDVGFGKTEIAIRAAFKAVCDGKQVAMLVPTTVLALQHYKTFVARMQDFPVSIDYMTRGRSEAQAKKLLDKLAAGQLDVIIGTHALLGRRVKFHDLGLLIIDEEQKFGVGVKEKLRQRRVNVDTLTLTATPIPRTLQFSLMGARDLSVLQTPPPNRYPVQTEIVSLNADIIREAIEYEINRNGQVFFIHNRVHNINEIADMLRSLVPSARVSVGHGQMPNEKLEEVILDFVNYDSDILVATSIIENGIDIPNANTILINEAQHFGLSDLHQLRGRVGRSNRKAFCYLIAPPLSVLPDDSRRRLLALEGFADLGSGFHIAMQDLDIRGAGNLLGAEQSGFIADVGYEMYQKILEEAMRELRQEEEIAGSDTTAELTDTNGFNNSTAHTAITTTIDSDLALFFPDSYIPGNTERMNIYRELDNITDDDALACFRQRIEDRFGNIPEEGEQLMLIVSLRRLAAQLNIERVVLRQGRMICFFSSDMNAAYYQSEQFGRALTAIQQLPPQQCKLKQENKTGSRAPRLTFSYTPVQKVASAIAVLQRLL